MKEVGLDNCRSLMDVSCFLASDSVSVRRGNKIGLSGVRGSHKYELGLAWPDADQ